MKTKKGRKDCKQQKVWKKGIKSYCKKEKQKLYKIRKLKDKESTRR